MVHVEINLDSQNGGVYFAGETVSGDWNLENVQESAKFYVVFDAGTIQVTLKHPAKFRGKFKCLFFSGKNVSAKKGVEQQKIHKKICTRCYF